MIDIYSEDRDYPEDKIARILADGPFELEDMKYLSEAGYVSDVSMGAENQVYHVLKPFDLVYNGKISKAEVGDSINLQFSFTVV